MSVIYIIALRYRCKKINLLILVSGPTIYTYEESEKNPPVLILTLVFINRDAP